MTADQMAALHALCFTTPRPWRADEFTDLLSATGCILVTRDEGFALGRAIAGEAELLTIAVHPDHRRKGIARDVLSEFLTKAAEQGAQNVFLEVAQPNHAAQALYQAAGFERIGQRKVYYKTPQGAHIDALILGITLPTLTK